jgi:hypothetical protein
MAEQRTLAHTVVADPAQHPGMRLLWLRLTLLQLREMVLNPLGDSIIDVANGRIKVERTPPQPIQYRTHIIEREGRRVATGPRVLPDELLGELVALGASQRTLERLRKDVAESHRNRRISS